MTGADLRSITSQIAPSLSGKTPGALISDVVSNYFIPAAGLIMFLFLIFGGYQVMFSGGDPKAVEAGKGKITGALIGFIIIFASYWIVQAISIAFGLKTLADIF